MRRDGLVRRPERQTTKDTKDTKGHEETTMAFPPGR